MLSIASRRRARLRRSEVAAAFEGERRRAWTTIRSPMITIAARVTQTPSHQVGSPVTAMPIPSPGKKYAAAMPV
jgi:hypothetical protein